MGCRHFGTKKKAGSHIREAGLSFTRGSSYGVTSNTTPKLSAPPSFVVP
jgi:hypothetical protein